MSKKSEYQMALEMEMEKGDASEFSTEASRTSNLLSEDLKNEINRLKKREWIYFGLLGTVLIGSAIFGFRTYQANGQQVDFNQSGYTQPVNYSQDSTGYIADVTASGDTSGGGGCGTGGTGSGGGCCGGTGSGTAAGGTASTLDVTKIAAEGKAFYLKQSGSKEKNIDCKVTDYGCHIQCDVMVAGQKMKSYAYQNGSFREI